MLPFFMLKNAKNTRGESDVGDETYSGQGKANEDKVEWTPIRICHLTSASLYLFSVSTVTIVPVDVTNFNRFENHQVRYPRTHFRSFI